MTKALRDIEVGKYGPWLADVCDELDELGVSFVNLRKLKGLPGVASLKQRNWTDEWAFDVQYLDHTLFGLVMLCKDDKLRVAVLANKKIQTGRQAVFIRDTSKEFGDKTAFADVAFGMLGQ